MAWQKSGRVLVVGLGNPGPQYAETRHNIGFMLADALAGAAGIQVQREKFAALYGTGEWKGRPVVILKPQTYMNLSGRSVSSALSFFGLELSSAVVLHDDVDLPLADVRVKVGGGHGGHNGLRSIVQETGGADFVRVRLGIGRPTRRDMTSHVLGRFSETERAEGVATIDVGMRALSVLFEQGPTEAMNLVNGLYRTTREDSGRD